MGPVEIIAIVLAVLCVGAAIAVPIVRKKKGKSGLRLRLLRLFTRLFGVQGRRQTKR